MNTIKFRANVGVDDAIEAGLDTDYYLYELDLEDIDVSIVSAVYADLDFTAWYDDSEEDAEEDLWNRICMEFDRPQRIDGGNEF